MSTSQDPRIPEMNQRSKHVPIGRPPEEHGLTTDYTSRTILSLGKVNEVSTHHIEARCFNALPRPVIGAMYHRRVF